MPSPFPGMDPFLEPYWLDIHTGLIGEARRVLNRRLPVGLVARAEERIAIEPSELGSQRIGPDIRVFSPASSDPSIAATDLLIDAPYKLVVELDPLIERFIRIVNKAWELITVVEFLNPSNKRAPGLADYREKRRALLQAGAHVVEVDLVRTGDWRALMRPEVAPPEAATAPYRAVVRTAGPRPAAYLFPITARQAMPEVPVPLRRGDPVIKLPLQIMLETVYTDGRYDATLNYRKPLDPPLESEDAAWFEAQPGRNV